MTESINQYNQSPEQNQCIYACDLNAPICHLTSLTVTYLMIADDTGITERHAENGHTTNGNTTNDHTRYCLCRLWSHYYCYTPRTVIHPELSHYEWSLRMVTLRMIKL